MVASKTPMAKGCVGDITELLQGVNSGRRESLDRLLGLMYDDLRRLAHRRLRASPFEQSLNTTGLVHESYLRLLKAGRVAVSDRGHFMIYAAHVMRSIIIDLLRQRKSERRGGLAFHVTLDTAVSDEISASNEDLIQVDDALNELGHSSPRLVQIVELRYFVGMSEAETAQALNIAVRTVRRDLQKARLLLKAMLKQGWEGDR